MNHADAFADLYREIHDGQEPFAWQVRAAAELCEGTIWPTLSAPTASGKTTLIDCWLYARSQRDDLPRRLFWVVDRRGVVDQVAAYATDVLSGLADSAPGSPAHAVYERLCAVAGGAEPLVRIWRGALDDERLADQARDPLEPALVAIVCSTVDQVGSRLLFDGYGIAARSRPLHAGLIGVDSLVVLDEAHLAEPFLQTVRRVAAIQGERAALRPLSVVPITATPREDEGGFRLTSAELAEETVARRLNAAKPTRLVPLTGTQPTAAVGVVRPLLEPGSVTGVVLNTVRDARLVYDKLRQKRDVNALLVIGPARPIDRASLLAEIPSREQRSQLEHATAVVGTQTLEVGLDLDFDALVTACAPLPSLVQRFGRLDRFGQRGESAGVILGPPKRCPVYGEATDLAWEWLAGVEEGLDFGVNAMRSLTAHSTPPAPEPSPHTPLLLQPHAEALRMTSFRQQRPPEVALFLHGYLDDVPEVQIGWRGDLREDVHSEWIDRVQARPPHPGELVSLPLPAVRRWLAGQEADSFPDLEGVSLERGRPGPEAPRSAVRIPPSGPDGERTAEIVTADELDPGDVLLVPSSYGGCDRFGWAPASTAPVTDLGNLSHRPRLLLPSEDPSVSDSRRALDQDLATPSDVYAALRGLAQDWLRVGAGLPEPHQREVAAGIELPSEGTAIAVGESDIVLVAQRVRRTEAGRPVTYRAHAQAVEKRVLELVHACGLGAELTRALQLAARYHDLGKLDPRFQAWLADGSQQADEPLAKSGGVRSPRRIVAAREASGWPAGKRHELVSAALVERVDLGEEVDSGLVQHLVTTHHGYGRPFFLVVSDDHAPSVSAEIEGRVVRVLANELPPWSSHVRTLTRLEDEFGLWGLAYLEALLVLADRAVSAGEGAT